jgi:hypothetical protein
MCIVIRSSQDQYIYLYTHNYIYVYKAHTDPVSILII